MSALPSENRPLTVANDAPAFNLSNLVMQGGVAPIYQFAEMMAKGSVTVPRHLQGNVADCFAVATQAFMWNMNPFAVAQKTHVSPSGALGYEAQLISAALVASGAVQGDPEYEYIGDWNKILGKVEERKSEKGGKYYVATYTKAEENGLGIICKLRLKGESKPREMEVMMSQCYPRFSTQWATNPKQQISYVAVRLWARMFKPGVILGVYTDDEFENMAGEKHMGPADVVEPPPPPPPPITEWPDDLFADRLPEWHKAIATKRATADNIIAKAQTKYPLTDAQKDAIRKGAATDVGPVLTYAEVADKIAKASNFDALNDAGDLIGAVADPQQRTELSALFEKRVVELNPVA